MNLSQIPVPALVCGLVGLIPFVFLSIGIYVFPYAWKLIEQRTEKNKDKDILMKSENISNYFIIFRSCSLGCRYIQ